eukprot:TRINITY_DN51725_c0_g1_i1.p1 TRINITY_DN51725_c0_g1~~TRINITY_DN51725_c0_g1_i1.p1  ORF type:complete len:218 (+),score=29.49 TRINITY_DN51725_c0_g1_i1:45-698(+)
MPLKHFFFFITISCLESVEFGPTVRFMLQDLEFYVEESHRVRDEVVVSMSWCNSSLSVSNTLFSVLHHGSPALDCLRTWDETNKWQSQNDPPPQDSETNVQSKTEEFIPGDDELDDFFPFSTGVLGFGPTSPPPPSLTRPHLNITSLSQLLSLSQNPELVPFPNFRKTFKAYLSKRLEGTFDNLLGACILQRPTGEHELCTANPDAPGMEFIVNWPW